VIIALWFAIVVSVVLFFRVSALAGALLLPYLAWVSFAAYLNAGFVLLNR
jgi:translocator protein